jgi:hypothetical protein
MMPSTLMLLALSALAGDAAPLDRPTRPATTAAVIECVARRLKPFVSPYGIQQAWPVSAALPASQQRTLGALLSDNGNVADGYQQFLHVDDAARTVHVVQQGGFAGTTKVYGPLPLPHCAPADGASAGRTSPR